MVVARVTELLRLHISNIAPRGLCRGHWCSRRPEERHLFLLVNANKVLLPNVGLCEHCACNTGTGAEPQFLSSSESDSLKCCSGLSR